MFCANCGAQGADSATFCEHCGAAVSKRLVSSADVGEGQVSQSHTTVTPQARVKYAGFWIRFIALLIDSAIIMGFIIAIAATSFFLATQESSGVLGLTFFILFIPLAFLVPYVYCIVLTYKKGATFGKMAVGIKVISSENTDLRLGQVVLRETIGKFISGILLNIGYIMAGLTVRKQALHDMIAQTYVVYSDAKEETASPSA